MKKSTKRRVFISKIREHSKIGFRAKSSNDFYFWYQITGVTRRILIKGTFKDLTIKREELIEKYKSEYIKLGV